jgi:hypothetical protein
MRRNRRGRKPTYNEEPSWPRTYIYIVARSRWGREPSYNGVVGDAILHLTRNRRGCEPTYSEESSGR